MTLLDLLNLLRGSRGLDRHIAQSRRRGRRKYPLEMRYCT